MASDFDIREDDSLQCAVLLQPAADHVFATIEDARYVQWARIYEGFTDDRKQPRIVRFLLLGEDAGGKDHKYTRVVYPYEGQVS